jgi:FtsZ-binding cell division protein ZapB
MRDDHNRYEKLRADYKKALDTVQILDETILRVMELEKENDELRRRLIDCKKSTA